MKRTLLIASAAFAAILSTGLAEEGNLYPEGNFEGDISLNASGTGKMTKDFSTAEEGVLYIEPGDYKAKGEVSVTKETEDGNSFIRFRNAPGSKLTGILRAYIVLKLPSPAPSGVTVSLRWRLSEWQPVEGEGAQPWASAQADPQFRLADGTTKPVNNTFRLKKVVTEWTEVEKSVTVPEGATHLILPPGLYAGYGTLDIDDIKVIAE
jgi:hypothetical protein